MTGTVGVDTAFLIDFFDGDVGAVAFMRTYAKMLRISELVVYEVLCGKLTEKEKATVFSALQSFPALPFNRESALIASDLYRECKRKGTSVDHKDCMIAGSYLAHGVKTIVTRNKKDFERLQTVLTY